MDDVIVQMSDEMNDVVYLRLHYTQYLHLPRGTGGPAVDACFLALDRTVMCRDAGETSVATSAADEGTESSDSRVRSPHPC